MKTMIGVCKSRTLLNIFGAALLMLFALVMSKPASANNACCGLTDWEVSKQSCYTQHWVPGAYGIQGHYETIPCYGNKPVVQDDNGPYYYKHCKHYMHKHHKYYKCKYYSRHSKPWYNNYYHRDAVTKQPEASVSQPTVYKQ